MIRDAFISAVESGVRRGLEPMPQPGTLDYETWRLRRNAYMAMYCLPGMWLLASFIEDAVAQAMGHPPPEERENQC